MFNISIHILLIIIEYEYKIKLEGGLETLKLLEEKPEGETPEAPAE